MESLYQMYEIVNTLAYL